MSIARKDDRHNQDLAKEIVDSFNRAVGSPSAAQTDDDEEPDEDQGSARARFVVTGDKRFGQRDHRKTD